MPHSPVFAAIVSAFIFEGYKKLSLESNETFITILEQIS
jgi:hypothetical protein